MGDEENTGYDNTHRAFLQSFVARSTFTFEEAKPVLAVIFGARGTFCPISRSDIVRADKLKKSNITTKKM